jgi:hypothetical protein
MTTKSSLVEEVLLNLAGYLTDQELVGTLASGLTPSTATFTVNGAVFPDGAGFQPGLAEVGDELVYVQQVNRSTGSFSGVLRGFRGTTAFNWPSGTLVRANPRVPRISVVRNINDTLRSLFPRLYAVSMYEFTMSGGQATYNLPANVTDVLSVQWSVPGSSQYWQPSRRWQFNPNAPTVSGTGRQLTVWDAQVSRTVQVVVKQTPGEFDETSGTNEDYTTATGLPEWTREVVSLGAAFRAVNYMDAGRVAERTVEGDWMGSQGGQTAVSAQKLAAHLFAMFNERMKAAEERLRAENNVGSVHFLT